MTKEDLTKIMELKAKIDNIQNMISNDRISLDSINYIYRNENEFNKELHELQTKYILKYKEEFENITINYHDGE